MTASFDDRARLVRLGVVALAAGLVLTGCGDQSDTDAATDQETSSPEPTPTETTKSNDPQPRGPACATVWIDGESLPERYKGCFDEDKDKWVRAEVYRCGSGQQLVTYTRNFYAAKGGVINETATPLAKDADFKKAMAACGA